VTSYLKKKKKKKKKGKEAGKTQNDSDFLVK
jgi:hypothetical protein